MAASLSPEDNLRRILACLSTPPGIARLAPGIFPLHGKLTVPPGSKLYGAAGSQPSSTLVAGRATADPSRPKAFADNTLLETQDNNVVDNLRINGNGQLHLDCCTTVVAITGSHARLHRLEIFDRDPSSSKIPGKATGIYFIGQSKSSDNFVEESLIHNVTLGVIFRAGLPRAQPNGIVNSEVTSVACDAVTLAGYGVVSSNLIHGNGFACGQTPVPIPGAGIYALDNRDGARIVGNEIRDVCGNGLDIVRSDNFTVDGNRVVLEGMPLGGKYPVCGGGSAVNFVDIRRFSVTNNLFRVVNLPPLGMALEHFPAFAKDSAHAFSMLPDARHQVVAVRVVQDKKTVEGNVFRSNEMTAHCDRPDVCAGLGLYVGPDIGIDKEGQRTAKSHNDFSGNDFNGSDITFVNCDTPDGHCAGAATQPR